MFEVLRAILPEGGQHKGTSSCQGEGCPKSTREGKPYCSAHITQSSYVRKILAELAQRDAEEVILEKRRGRIDPGGFFYRETLFLLRIKDFTAKGLSRSLDLSHHATERLILMMAADKLATKARTSRGDLTISGIGEKPLSGLDE
ncbi:MAG: hypothetical protein ACYSWU_22465 [Planctomycetota bacterium]|jgi:hypothetical protein